MTMATFDTTLQTARAIKAAGLKPEAAAEAIAEGINHAVNQRSRDYATKADIAELRTATKADIDGLRTATKADIDGLRTATKADIASLRADIGTMIEKAKNAYQRTVFGAVGGAVAILLAGIRWLG